MSCSTTLAEGDHTGTDAQYFKGIDNPELLHSREDGGSRYANYTGCGNTPNANHPGRAADDRGQPALYWV